MITGDDHIDHALAGWASLDADLDIDTMRTSLVFARAAAVGRRHVDESFRACGISAGEFDVLAALIHAPNRSSTPTELSRVGMLSPAGMTHRLDALERSGFVQRRPAPEDRRSTIVELTEAGAEKALEAARAHVAAEQELFAVLDDDERRQLDTLILRLLGQRSSLPDSAARPSP